LLDRLPMRAVHDVRVDVQRRLHAGVDEMPAAACGDVARSGRGGNRSWAALMQRTFGLDVLACPSCGGRLRLIALIEQRAAVTRILAHLGLPTELPEPRPARPPPDPAVHGSAADDSTDVFVPAS
jgi:hypothetical protein